MPNEQLSYAKPSTPVYSPVFTAALWFSRRMLVAWRGGLTVPLMAIFSLTLIVEIIIGSKVPALSVFKIYPGLFYLGIAWVVTKRFDKAPTNGKKLGEWFIDVLRYRLSIKRWVNQRPYFRFHRKRRLAIYVATPRRTP